MGTSWRGLPTRRWRDNGRKYFAKSRAAVPRGALQTLPNAEIATEDFQEAVIELPVFGQVRFTCQRMTARQGKYRARFWSAIEAFKVEQ